MKAMKVIGFDDCCDKMRAALIEGQVSMTCDGELMLCNVKLDNCPWCGKRIDTVECKPPVEEKERSFTLRVIEVHETTIKESDLPDDIDLGDKYAVERYILDGYDAGDYEEDLKMVDRDATVEED